jgi:hypothetical protein
MTSKTSREVMAWRPPDGWRDMSTERRREYLRDHAVQTPDYPVDWGEMDWSQRAAYRSWNYSLLGDNTPEKRAAEGEEYRKELLAWRVLMCWWVFCLVAALALVWWPDGPLGGGGVVLLTGFTVFVLVGYYLALFAPMQIAKPVPPIRR